MTKKRFLDFEDRTNTLGTVRKLGIVKEAIKFSTDKKHKNKHPWENALWGDYVSGYLVGDGQRKAHLRERRRKARA